MCTKIYHHKFSLARQMRTHTGYMVKCSACPTKYTEYCHLQQHIHTEHNGARLSCDLCGKVHSTKLGLSGHMPEHTGNFKTNARYVSSG